MNNTERKLTGSIGIILILSICLAITTFALIYSMVAVEDNLFGTGVVKINLNDGKPVIEEHEYLFEPGMTVEKQFTLTNESTWDVYYRIYFKNIEGGLADVLDVTVTDDEHVLLQGKMSELTDEYVGAADDVLKIKEEKVMTISFHFPKDEGNEAQNLYLYFDIGADAVQTKNNPNRQFE